MIGGKHMAVTELTSSNFEESLKGNGLALVDFWAEWCGPCQMQGPVVDELADERTDINVYKVNVDKESELAVRFQVTNIPSLIFFKNGQMVKKVIGFHSREELEEIMSAL